MRAVDRTATADNKIKDGKRREANQGPRNPLVDDLTNICFLSGVCFLISAPPIGYQQPRERSPSMWIPSHILSRPQHSPVPVVLTRRVSKAEYLHCAYNGFGMGLSNKDLQLLIGHHIVYSACLRWMAANSKA